MNTIITADTANKDFVIACELSVENPERKGYLKFERKLTGNECYAMIEKTLSLITVDFGNGDITTAKGACEWCSEGMINFETPLPKGRLIALPREGNSEGYIIEIFMMKDNKLTSIATIKYLIGGEETWAIAYKLTQAISSGFTYYEE